MTYQANRCADAHEMGALLQGEMDENQQTRLTDHLDGCARCRELLESCCADDRDWQETGLLLQAQPFDAESQVFASDISAASSEPKRLKEPAIQLVLKSLAPTDDPSRLGRIGGYEISGVIGAGGMGVVLKAFDGPLDRSVAIKVLAPHLACNGSARQRFAREAKAAAAVLHPNVIAIHSVSDGEESTGLPYLVMPYIRGASLQARIDSSGPLTITETLRVAVQIADGLAAAHAQGLVHRDIKPANILLEEGIERVSITDFGLARAADDATLTCSGVIAGTPQYMSPEQAKGHAVDARSDLFSLGSVIYAMCAGRPPFRAETSYGVLRRITDEPATPIREINPSVPAWFSRLLDRLHAKSPEDRFGSAEHARDVMSQCLAHLQTANAQLPSELGPVKRWNSRSMRLIAIVAIGAVLFVALLPIWNLTIESDGEPTPDLPGIAEDVTNPVTPNQIDSVDSQASPDTQVASGEEELDRWYDDSALRLESMKSIIDQLDIQSRRSFDPSHSSSESFAPAANKRNPER